MTLLDTGAAEQARHWAPLFDTVRAVRNLEMALRLMWEAHLHALAGTQFTTQFTCLLAQKYKY